MAGQSQPSDSIAQPHRGAAVETGFLRAASDRVVWLEKRIAGAFVAAIFCLLIANVVTRMLSIPVIWIDELAVHFMIVGAFFGASIAIREREHIAVTLLRDALRGPGRTVLVVGVDLMVILFIGALAVILWRWFDPLGILAAESRAAYAAATFNFLYDEPTTTIGIRKVWFWLVLPVFCSTALLHASANLTGTLCAVREDA
ncbi:TRAP transporter small permease [Pacificispira spongiicola]|uniref:TRAP transporter small permease n=1 Tax=Pacificispira spongiicola TaxID=2729598 RepID=UPI0029CA46CC|nr:TRAP transporter small permease subunit [Pacificispira spongiicola]